ncbi:MAG: DUF6174 domain-containing protein [Gemmatimonadetes bacterium]|nr:DUF6174 domain-containing protein [Gemmatimonadota bacterium]MDA1103503.1 DUF6174 domain-containing protein [Gemmatimonadota bacterium]
MSIRPLGGAGIVFGGAILLGSCGTLGLGSSVLDELERNQERWERVAPAAYQYAVERLCFCGLEARGPVRVTVVGSAVSSRVYVDSGDPVPANFGESFPTVPGLFDILRDAIDRDAHEIRVTYDPETGVPIDFWIDYLEMAIDEELGIRVTEAVAQPLFR